MEEQCILCLENMINETPLSCGHVFHINCIKKHFKPECPICRTEHNIPVLGSKPELFLPFNTETTGDVYTQIFDNNYMYLQVYFEFEEHEEENHEEEDEENPRYDNWDYEDV